MRIWLDSFYKERTAGTEMPEGKIIIVTHKDYEMPGDAIYFPICVGTGIPALSGKFQPDNTGEHISNLNSTYCELTAIYWAWKNLDLNALDYVGVAHYRRHFSLTKKAGTLDKAITGGELEKLGPGVYVTPKRTYLSSIESHYVHSLKGYEQIHAKDIARLREAIHTCCPDYDAAADRVLTGRSAHMLNMFIMSGRDFGDYCAWLFPVIDRVVALSTDREDQRRYAGALSEFCLDIWLGHNGITPRELPLLETERVSFLGKVVACIKRKLG